MSNNLRRNLKARHLTMIAIGGSIGTGLFVGSGATIATAGTAGALIAYSLIGFMVFFLMTSLGEMSAYNPSSGSFAEYGTKYVDPAFGFAQGWNYWYNWAITLAVELVAAAIVMSYWFPNVNPFLWSLLFFIIIVGLNLISVKGFGETEFWFSLIKVITVIIFIIVGFLMIFGIMTSDKPVGGFSNISNDGNPFFAGFLPIVGIFMIAAFSFQGTELIGVAAGESENPKKNIPKAIKQIFWRILLFYILSIFIIGMLIPHTDPALLKNDDTDISYSPFTLVFERAGLAFSAGLMNAIILTAILSAGNSGLYASSRILYIMAKNKMAPKLFGISNKAGVPVYAVIATAIIAALSFLTSKFDADVIYLTLLNTSGMCGFVAWIGISICHYRFRRALIKQGVSLKSLPYKAKWFPFGPLFALILCIIIIIGQDYESLINLKWSSIIPTYIGLLLFIILYFGYKIIKKTKLVNLSEMELTKFK